MSAETHYTATVEVTKTVHTPEERGRYNEGNKPASREVQEIARVVLRADSLEDLRERIVKHVDLLA